MAVPVHTHPGRPHLGGHPVLIWLASLAVLATFIVAAVTTGFFGLSTSDDAATTDSASVSYETLEHARRVGVAGRELAGLRAVVVSVPTMAPDVREDIALLELVVKGQLPVEAAESAAVPETTSPLDELMEEDSSLRPLVNHKVDPAS